MKNTQKVGTRRGKLLLILCLCTFAVIYIILLNILCNVETAESVVFLLAQLTFVLLPGMCLLLYIKPPKSAANYLSVSYMLGMGIMIAQSFLYGAFRLTSLSVIPMSAISVLSVLGIYKKRSQFTEVFKSASLSDSFSLLCLTAAMLIVTAVWGIPVYNTPDLTERGVSYLYHDILWNVGNTVTLANGLPVSDIHVSGITFGYHYFINAFLAPFFNVLDISAYTLYFKFLPVISAIVTCGGFYIFIGSLFKNRAWAAVLSAVSFLCCSNLFLEILWYAYAAPISMGISLAAAYYFIKLFKRFDTVKISDRSFILFMLLLIIATGIKTLLAAAVIGGAGITILAQIFYRRKNIKIMLLMGILIIAAVAAIYFALIYGTHAFNSLSRAFASLMWISGDPSYYSAALEAFPSLPTIVVKAICYPIYLILTFPICVAAIIALFVCLIKKTGGFYIPMFLFSGILVGLGAASVIYQPGMSNLYFLEGALPLCAYGLFYIILKCGLKRALKAAMTAITAISMIYMSWISIDDLNYNYNFALPGRARTGGGSAYDTINSGEYQGMLWIRDNTDRADIIASDRQYYAPVQNLNEARYFYYTAFSERQNYLEGYNYVSTHNADYQEIIEDKLQTLERVYQNDPEAVKMLYDGGVRYLAATRFVHPDFVLNESLGEEVFSNSEIAIYKFNEPGS